jgi:hypothetical protein
MFRFLTTALAFFATTTTTIATISNCGTAASRFQLTALDFQPAAPAPGDSVFMTVEFQNPGSEVTDGKARRTVTLNGLPVVDETVALCGEATTCPLTAGFNNRSAASSWPDVTGKIVSTIRWYDPAGAELLCIKTAVTSAAVSHSNLRGPTATDMIHIAQPFFSHSTALIALESEEPEDRLCLLEDRPHQPVRVRGAKGVKSHA